MKLKKIIDGVKKRVTGHQIKIFILILSLVGIILIQFFENNLLQERQGSSPRAQSSVICSTQGGCGGKCNIQQNNGCGYGGCRFWEYCADFSDNGIDNYSCWDTTANGTIEPNWSLACGYERANASPPRSVEPTRGPTQPGQIYPTNNPFLPTNSPTPQISSQPQPSPSGSSCTWGSAIYPHGFCSITSTDVGFYTNMKVFLYCDKSNANASSLGWVQERTGTTCPRYSHDLVRNTACMANNVAVNSAYPCCSGYSENGICKLKTGTAPQATSTPTPSSTLLTPTLTLNPSLSVTLTPTGIVGLSPTATPRQPSLTSSPVPTTPQANSPTPTSIPTQTPRPTSTSIPTATPTRQPTQTPIPSASPTPTLSPCTVGLVNPQDERVITNTSEVISFTPCPETNNEWYLMTITELVSNKTNRIKILGLSHYVYAYTADDLYTQSVGAKFFTNGQKYQWQVAQCVNADCTASIGNRFSGVRYFYWKSKSGELPSSTPIVSPKRFATATLIPIQTTVSTNSPTPSLSLPPTITNTPVPQTPFTQVSLDGNKGV